MPLTAKRRKVSATTTHSLTAPAAQRSIQAFGKISKPQVQAFGKSALGKDSTTTNSKSDCSSASVKKRKLELISVEEEDAENTSTLGKQAHDRPGESSTDSPTPTLTLTGYPPEKLPVPSDCTETPTKGARSRLECLGLASSPASSSTASSLTTWPETPPSSPISADSERCRNYESQQWPDELQDLVNLYSSFLTALSLHYAHNGSMTPADVRNLTPGIERTWRKKRVTIHDVRRVLAIGRPEGTKQCETAGLLHLSDYGHGKICVEVSDHSDSRTARRRPVNEEKLNMVFLRNLQQRWMCYKIDNPAKPSPPTFLESLPLLQITPCTSLSKVAPLLSKGQRRLEDLKAGAIKAQQKPLSVTSANTTTLPQPKPKQTSTRSEDLFSRLKAKQLHQSTLPSPPSTEALARKSALQRVHEIAPVLGSLALSSKKHANDDVAAVDDRIVASPVSFTMSTLVQHLQMSLRNPIAKEEVIRSVRVMAELAPEWVGLKEMGKMLTVTIRGKGMSKDRLEREVQSLLTNL